MASDGEATRTLAANAPASERFKTYRLRVSSMGRPETLHEVAQKSVRVGSMAGNDLVLSDESVSRIHFEIAVVADGFRLRDLGSRNGTFVDGRRVWDAVLGPGARIVAGRTSLVLEPLEAEAEVPLLADGRFGPLVGRSAAMRAAFALLSRAARSDITILVEGETGTGKEVVAQAIHAGSPRAGGPFVVFDCAAVSPNLIESHLFGHERGAFTGAEQRRIGSLEEAGGGTLVLDELGELPLALQPKLLRALEAREFTRVGGTKTHKVDVRIVACTNRDLAAEVNRGSFRNDLYHRLAVVRLTIPPLRDRREDISPLVEHFVRRAFAEEPARADRMLAGLDASTWHRLESHAWPGNVRELRNVVQSAIALAAPDVPTTIAIEAPAAATGGAPTEPAPPPPSGVDLERPFADQRDAMLAAFEEAYLVGILDKHGGNYSRAAAAAGLDRMYFKRLVKKYRP